MREIQWLCNQPRVYRGWFLHRVSPTKSRRENTPSFELYVLYFFFFLKTKISSFLRCPEHGCVVPQLHVTESEEIKQNSHQNLVSFILLTFFLYF